MLRFNYLCNFKMDEIFIKNLLGPVKLTNFLRKNIKPNLNYVFLKDVKALYPRKKSFNKVLEPNSKILHN